MRKNARDEQRRLSQPGTTRNIGQPPGTCWNDKAMAAWQVRRVVNSQKEREKELASMGRISANYTRLTCQPPHRFVIPTRSWRLSMLRSFLVANLRCRPGVFRIWTARKSRPRKKLNVNPPHISTDSRSNTITTSSMSALHATATKRASRLAGVSDPRMEKGADLCC